MTRTTFQVVFFASHRPTQSYGYSGIRVRYDDHSTRRLVRPPTARPKNYYTITIATAVMRSKLQASCSSSPPQPGTTCCRRPAGKSGLWPRRPAGQSRVEPVRAARPRAARLGRVATRGWTRLPSSPHGRGWSDPLSRYPFPAGSGAREPVWVTVCTDRCFDRGRTRPGL